MSNGLTVRQKTEILPRFAFDEMVQIADVASKSGLFKMNRDQVLTLMMLCESEGLHPIKALQLYDIIDGRPSLKAVALLARFLESGGRVEWHEQSSKAAEATFTHPQTCPTGVRIRYTLEDAQIACLAHKDNWKKNPADMLVARVCSRGVKRANPACILGMELPEQDDQPAPIETTARTGLIDKLAARREKPYEVHPAVAETVAELKNHEQAATTPEPQKEPATEWGKWIADQVLDFNQQISQMADANAENLKLRTAVKPQQVINGALTAAIKMELTREEAILNEKGKRDNAKMANVMAELWENEPEAIPQIVGNYLAAKMLELTAKAPAPMQGELAGI